MYLPKSNVVTRQRLMIIAYAPITQQRWFSPPNPDGSKQICKNPKIVFLFIITFDQMLTTINWYQRKMQTKVNSIEDEVKKKKPVITFSITTTSPTDQLNCLYLKALTSFYHRIIILYHITQYALFWFQQPSTINASPPTLNVEFHNLSLSPSYLAWCGKICKPSVFGVKPIVWRDGSFGDGPSEF